MGSSSVSLRPSSQIIVCGQTIPVDWERVYNFRDYPEFDATQERCFLDQDEQPTARKLPYQPADGVGRSTRRYATRSLMHGSGDLGRLQQIIRQFVVHHDGLFGARQCFHVLHDERGLSVHFIIDNDGTIYQTLDLLHGAYHATGVNACSIGVEICNRGMVVSEEEHHYSGAFARGQQRVEIHGSGYQMWQFTDRQYEAMTALGQALVRVFPNLPPIFPEDSSGRAIPTAINGSRDFSGYLGHYHVTRSKWDPGCFDFKRVLQAIRGKPTWFIMPGANATPIEDEPMAAQAQAQALFENNRDEAMGGYFPVGPCGDVQVWHGGVHISQNEGTLIYNPFPGRVVVARSGYTSAIGSSDFVLIEHRFSLRGKSVHFYMLYFHVDLSIAPPWFVRARARRTVVPLHAGEVFFPDAFVAGGEPLGRVGLAGPPGSLEGQVHVEVMSLDELGAEFQPGFFRPLSADASPFCSEREILGPLDRQRQARPGRPARSVLRQFFQRDPDSQALQRFAVRFQSEWVRSAIRDEELLRSRDFLSLPAPKTILREQIHPTQWWTPEVARRIGLPEDGVVWHYHPVVFLPWMHGLLRVEALARSHVSAAPAAASSQPVTDGYKGDVGYLDDEDRMTQENNNLDLEQITEGWPDESAHTNGG